MMINIVIIIQIHLSNANADSPSLTINRSIAHNDKSGGYTSLVVSQSIKDKDEKVKPVELVFIIDISSCMADEHLDLVKESLKFLVKLMSDTDNFTLVTFLSNSQKVNTITKVIRKNKNLILKNIEMLNVGGGRNTYSGLEKGLETSQNE